MGGGGVVSEALIGVDIVFAVLILLDTYFIADLHLVCLVLDGRFIFVVQR